jgi:hypothetical protein
LNLAFRRLQGAQPFDRFFDPSISRFRLFRFFDPEVVFAR